MLKYNIQIKLFVLNLRDLEESMCCCVVLPHNSTWTLVTRVNLAHSFMCFIFSRVAILNTIFET